MQTFLGLKAKSWRTISYILVSFDEAFEEVLWDLDSDVEMTPRGDY